ncbi:hypothetical protein N7478_001966 [Penicillium angulare]|uniref:uncharacterized protein n=1 Tax=Penicillium angulare TaxID=116970 RepID=UPI00253FD012|nr:uncharacterized protein N7478_001966 [Penicillium angulare]KAJ5288936.1 hypothetical protein N7478_001966 [Penicillium angulare]
MDSPRRIKPPSTKSGKLGEFFTKPPLTGKYLLLTAILSVVATTKPNHKRHITPSMTNIQEPIILTLTEENVITPKNWIPVHTSPDNDHRISKRNTARPYATIQIKVQQLSARSLCLAGFI